MRLVTGVGDASKFAPLYINLEVSPTVTYLFPILLVDRERGVEREEVRNRFVPVGDSRQPRWRTSESANQRLVTGRCRIGAGGGNDGA